MKRFYICVVFWFFHYNIQMPLYAQDDWELLLKLVEKRNEINDKTKEIMQSTLDYLKQLDVYPQSIAEAEINFMIRDYKDYCRKLYTEDNVTSIPGAKSVNELIFNKSKEILTSDKYSFLLEMMNRKKEMDNVLASLDLNEKQLAKIKESYNSFLNDPLRKKKDGSYLGFYFNPNDISKYSPKSGTCFLISQDGIVVTNNHIVENSEKFYIKLFTDNSSIKYSANLLVTDVKNDLALLKIDDKSFINSTLPFTIKNETAEVGEDIFVLGYPLTATMGEEIKVTNGIISSSTGFQGDITSYQISAPVQPGNSGGPLLNKNGDIIGIVSAKHTETENVTYAVKSAYLNLLINSIEPKIKTPTKNTYSKKNLVEKIKILKSFIFIIETE